MCGTRKATRTVTSIQTPCDTHGGTIVVAGGDDGVVHVWTLAEKEKEDRGDHVAEAAAATATSSQPVAA